MTRLVTLDTQYKAVGYSMYAKLNKYCTQNFIVDVMYMVEKKRLQRLGTDLAHDIITKCTMLIQRVRVKYHYIHNYVTIFDFAYDDDHFFTFLI